MTSGQNFEVQFERVLGLEYFDGPMSGVGFLSDVTAYYLKIVGWDEEYDERVFAAAEISTKFAERVWRAFEAVEAPRLPRWYPQSVGEGKIRAEVNAAIAALRAEAEHCGFRKLMQSRDLTGRIVGVELNDALCQAVQDMASADKLVDVKAAPVLQEFLRLITSLAGR